MKKTRHDAILKSISQFPISTQEELLATLKRSGFNVTQATVSRDIKELGLVKALGKDGKYRYVAPKDELRDNKNLTRIIAPSVKSVDYAMNTVVIRCFAGMAQAVCAAIDTLELENVVGTLAGDDTIFVLCRTKEDAKLLVERLNELTNK